MVLLTTRSELHRGSSQRTPQLAQRIRTPKLLRIRDKRDMAYVRSMATRGVPGGATIMQPTFFVNSSDIVGLAFTMFTNNITGSPFLTLVVIFMFLLVLAMGAGIPMEWTAIFLLPLSLYLMAFSSDWLQIAGFILIYLGILLAKTWFASER